MRHTPSYLLSHSKNKLLCRCENVGYFSYYCCVWCTLHLDKHSASYREN